MDLGGPAGLFQGGEELTQKLGFGANLAKGPTNSESIVGEAAGPMLGAGIEAAVAHQGGLLIQPLRQGAEAAQVMPWIGAQG